VITMEVIGTYLGLSQDQEIYDYFRRHKPRHGCWVFRTFDESGMCLLRGLFLGSLQNSFP
jgi:hypothetical protein